MRLSWECIVTEIWKDPNPSKTTQIRQRDKKKQPANKYHDKLQKCFITLPDYGILFYTWYFAL